MNYKYNPLTKMLEPVRTKDAQVNGEEAEWRTLKGHHVAIGENGEVVAGGIPNTNIGANHNSKVDASKSSNKTGKKSWSEMSKEERKSAESAAFEKYGDMTIKDHELKQKIEEASNTFKEIKKSYNKTGEIPDELFDNFKKSFLCVEMGDYRGKDGWRKMLNNNFAKGHDDVEMLNVLRKSNSAIDVENFLHTKL